jgi:hypothetical protein
MCWKLHASEMISAVVRILEKKKLQNKAYIGVAKGDELLYWNC